VDLRKYNSGFMKPDDVRDGPRQETIIHVYVGEKYNRPVLELASGEQFTVNATNNRILIKAYGHDSDQLIGKVVEFSLGYYKDWNTDPPEEKETVVVKPISPPSAGNGKGDGTAGALPPPLTPQKPDFDDEIPW
jgi:hypothetical protein